MSEFRVNSITNQDGSAGPQVCGVSTFSGKSGVQIPSGPTEFRRQDGGGRSMGLIAGAQSGDATMNKVEIPTKANATDFGDLTQGREMGAAFGSATRGVIGGGRVGSPGYAGQTTLDYVTLSSLGGANDFGNLSDGARHFLEGLSNQTRGMTMGGLQPSPSRRLTNISFVSIATTRDASVFGDLTVPASQGACFSSPTRGLCSLGGAPSIASEVNFIDFITISTFGDAKDFGDVTVARRTHTGTSSNIRGIFAGAEAPMTNTIDFVTIATLGNASNFGDLTVARGEFCSCSNNIRGVFAGGNSPGSTRVNTIDFITISTEGDAADFGDITITSSGMMGTGSNHGGLIQ